MAKEKSIFFPIVFHFHQPVGNFEHVFEHCYKKAYKPLLENLYKFPKVLATLHFSGNLLEWFIDNKPSFINKLKEMIDRGQVELIGGGYYEPIYAIIPDRDRLAQLNKLSDLISQEFGLKVNGAWLSERVWEPDYPSFLPKAGLKYVIVDDNHFRGTGIKEDDTLYSYNTENNGKSIRIFPINEPIRYFIPWKPTNRTIDYLKDKATEKGNRVAVMLSDAEKMGVWGSTHQICYIDEKGHLECDDRKPFIPTLFKKVTNLSWIKPITLSDYMEQYPAKDLIYLPTASYDKMEEWVLPTSIRRSFEKYKNELRENREKQDLYMVLKGGFWRHFLVKYPESNNMHKKMLYVREKLIEIEHVVEQRANDKNSTKISKLIEDAWNEIYKSQCNDPYWHGLFGGIYLQFLRFAIYEHLINAETIMDQINSFLYPKLDSYIDIIPLDFNKDSKMDLIIESDIFNLYIDPSDGGTIFELDYKPKSYNIGNLLTRWEEAYHEKQKVEKKELFIDHHRRSIFRTRFFSAETSLEELESNSYRELSDLIDANYDVITNQKEGNKAILELTTTGSIGKENSEKKFECQLKKEIIVEKEQITLSLEGTLDSQDVDDEDLDTFIGDLELGIDLPFFFNGNPNKFQWDSGDNTDDIGAKNEFKQPIIYKGTQFNAFDESYDLHFEIKVNSENDVKIGKFPIISYTYTEEGYKKIFQGTNIILILSNLSEQFSINIKIRID
ncbi:MAG: DUF1925 domain-containing protein [Promethearchaeota archaeon]|nr:MAG: DUF1925 domain-containing protein [Candidatus Lokiarchaeota archaeon]